MEDDDEMLTLLHAALAVEEREPPPDRIAALRRQAAEHGRPQQAPSKVKHLGRRLPWLAAAAAVVVAFGLGTVIADSGGTPEGPPVEFEAALQGPVAQARVTGVMVGIGRIVTVRSDDLPILPKGEYYEVWFVGPGDRPGRPNRISAGTFHPDDQGRSEVELTAAVDPTKYPELSVTAEPADGDPSPNGPDVLRAPIRLR